MKFRPVLIMSLLIATNLVESMRLRGLKEEEQEAITKAYARTRALLGKGEMAFLEQILEADNIIMERQQKGIVDQILASLSGVPSGGSTGGLSSLVGTGNTVRNPPLQAAPQTTQLNNATQTQQPQANNDNFLFSQISKVIINSGTGNVSGIVDEALKIGTPAPVRDLVNGIIGVAYCNGIRRLLGRC